MKSMALLVVLAAISFAQALPVPENRLEFEVASVRPATEDNSHNVNSDRGSFRAHNITLKRLIKIAYFMDIGEDNGEVFGGPKWVDTDGYDINAKIPDEFSHRYQRDQLGEMIQTLLAARFHLMIHREERQVSGYLLATTANNKLKMAAADTAEKGSSMNTKNGHLVAKNVNMQRMARFLATQTEKPVMDKTGLTGAFNFELDWMRERLDSKPDPSADSGPSLFTALEDQLGLKLKSATIPVPVIVIDRAERPDEN
jgi:uncharacterized protein (TIGR03435 family)